MPKIDELFKELIANKGSDLHLEQGQKPRIRVNGKLEPVQARPVLTQESILSLLEEIADNEAWQKYMASGDLDFAYEIKGTARFRCNYFRHFFGYGAVFRLIPSDIVPLEKLDMPETLKNFSQTRSGLILVTGPTGSGKSTTLAAIINHINETRCCKIITIEEPVEFLHKNRKSLITHREVGLDTESFASGLKGAIKSDADIILVGEMRDQETIHLALTAAEMGILVFGTLHTNSAAKTIDRIIDVFPTNKKNQIRASLSGNLKAVVAQQLLRSVDEKRRWVAYEIMLRSTALPSIIMSGESMRITSEIQLNRQSGMILMDDCLRKLLSDGKVTKEEAYMKALDKASFIV